MSNEDHSVCDSCGAEIGMDESFFLIQIFVANDWDDLLTFCKNCEPEGHVEHAA